MNNPGLQRWLFLGSAIVMAFAGYWWLTPTTDANFYFDYPIQSGSAVVLLVAGVAAFARGLREHLAHTIGRQLNYAVWEAAVYGLAGPAALVIRFDSLEPLWSFNGVMLTLLFPVALWMINRALRDYSMAAKGRERSGLERSTALVR